MPYKDPEKQRAAMRIIMRDRRAEEKKRREVEEKQFKLALIETLLELWYVTGDHSKYELRAQPKIREVTQVTKKPVDGITMKIDGEETPLYESESPDVSTTWVHEGVPQSLKPMVNRVQKWCFAKRVVVSEIRVKRDIEYYMTWTPSDLIARTNLYRESYLADQWKAMLKAGKETKDPYVKAKVAEWKALVNARLDAENYFERFVVLSILNNKKDEDILFEAKMDEKAKEYFQHFMEDHAKQIISDIRKILRGEELHPLMTKEEEVWAHEILYLEATAQTATAAKRLIDAKRKDRKYGIAEKKKKRSYTVTVNE